LVLPSRHRPPESLLGIRHEAEGEFLRDQPLDQAFRVRKVSLASARTLVRLRLRQMQRPRHRTGPGLRVERGRLRRIEQEARAAGQLNHPNVLTVYDVGVHDGAPFIVAELLEGEVLRQRRRRRL
jgi:serine/threonine protein kinase